MRKFIILFFCTIFAAKLASAQLAVQPAYKKSVFNTSSYLPAKKIVPALSPSMMVQPSFYIKNLAFFCRQEIKAEHFTGFPVKFRLGSVQYVDYLERKPNAVRP